MTLAILSLYFGALGALALFGVHRLLLTWSASRCPPTSPPEAPATLPTVCIQLPVFNEAFVAARVLRAAAAIRYPADRLHIQVLDDSNDATTAILQRVATELRAKGLRVDVVRRDDRVGYKAGALAHGLAHTDAELIAIFDADFVPPEEFLEHTVPLLVADPGCGMVQARWAHINRDASWLTRAQGLFLDGHFGVEHQARWCSGHPFNFNGTAGIWRRQAIDDAGGWSHETITEDLDLSYRAQIAGWRFAYTDGLLVPAELPERWTAFRAQQARWVRGSVETARRRLGSILSAPDWTWRQRFEGALHVTSNGAYLLMALIGILLPLTVVLRDRLGWTVPGGQLVLSCLDLVMLTSGTCAMVVFYAYAIRSAPDRGSRGRALELAFALCVGAGMCLSNAREVLRGLYSENSEFVRTPKRGQNTAISLARTYRSPPGTTLALVELLFAGLHGACIVYALVHELWGSIPFLLLYLVGFATVGAGSAVELLAGWRDRARVTAPDPQQLLE